MEGRVIYDSSFTQSGNHMMKISLRSCSAENGDRCTAEGVLTVLGQEEQIVSSGIAISLKGRFSEGLFVYDDLQVTGRSWFNTFRERVIGFLKRRMISSGDDGPSLLSCQLLLGRTDDGSLDMVRKARSCGCAHVLALSGMHLGILVGICTAVLGKGKLGKAMSVLAVAAFVMVAGPRPSLVRAALGCCLFFINNRKRMFLVLFIQLLVFPQSFYEVGCCYGYVAIFAIVHLAPYIEAVLFQYIGQFSKLVSATVSALLFTAPVQMLSNGFWCPCAIITSPLAGLLAALSMILGLLELVFGKVSVLVRLNGHVYSL
ncbi:MAG: ComEC/Rec2 family competence protein, partial [Spirochaetales bacterium]|nr:ComEC/Rec2 family competence protein [Spirochaetales bacterium]